MSSSSAVALSHAVAGAAAGVVSLSATYPLLTLTTRLQVKGDDADQTRRTERLSNLYAGLGTALMGQTVTQLTYYYFYSLFTSLYLKRKHPMNTTASILIASSAGALTTIITNPIWVVTTRMQTSAQRYDCLQVGSRTH
eukprot:TRINITY_DN401_c0_g1_i7.p1 TRINITY_DN401_c0_g1~~TRINITY_DN401_c0_g1_i7.p1  ORF type:complete len:139 (+),score=11.67 TRINITY_DN401_c0_g1_i7:208-624(+)